MRRDRLFLFAGALCSIVVGGCSAEPEAVAPAPDASSEAPSVTAQTASAARATDAPVGEKRQIPEAIAKLFAQMDSVGTSNQADLAVAFKDLRDAPAAVADLKKLYQSLPSTALAARWKTVYALGHLPSPEGLEFLEQVAGAAPEIAGAGMADAGSDVGFRLRYTAAVGVIQQHLAGIKGAQAAVDRLIDGADPSIAQLIGVELFSLGKLSPAVRERLGKRGIANKFRQLSEAELTALRTVDPSKDGHQGADTRTRPRFTSVPPMSDAEQQ